MPSKIVVPELGESVLEATVGHWRKKEGDPVGPGEAVVELETDKVDLEVGAEQEGVLAKIERKEGEDVKIGDVLGWIDEAAPGTQPASTAVSETAAASETSPPAVPAPPSPPLVSTAAPARPHGPSANQVSTPSARRLAREQGVDLAELPISAPGGRITRENLPEITDREARSAGPARGTGVSISADSVSLKAGATPGISTSAEPSLRQEQGLKPGGLSPAASVVPFAGVPELSEREERVRMSRRRMTIAQRLVEAQHAAALLTTFNEIDMGAILELRKRRKESFEQRYGVSLGIVSFFVKASIAALRQFPRLNAEVQGDEMVLKRYYDIGVAVGAPEGLVVPVLHSADAMSFAEIETAVKAYARRAREGTLALPDLRGGTFSITNGGVFGSLFSTPILNPPQSGILGLHKIEERAVAARGEVVVRPMMYVALTYDHRIVDGLEAVQFLVRVKELAEDPGTLLLES
ncbi:MAG: 2-oxoglutarate dehydrogenase complex dihydrolipoyllysine-residue succinyltransferase [Terriglobia bacterium]